jgi:hypothetical protein
MYLRKTKKLCFFRYMFILKSLVVKYTHTKCWKVKILKFEIVPMYISCLKKKNLISYEPYLRDTYFLAERSFGWELTLQSRGIRFETRHREMHNFYEVVLVEIKQFIPFVYESYFFLLVTRPCEWGSMTRQKLDTFPTTTNNWR